MHDSKVFDKMGVRDMGRISVSMDRGVGILANGVTLADLHITGRYLHADVAMSPQRFGYDTMQMWACFHTAWACLLLDVVMIPCMQICL